MGVHKFFKDFIKELGPSVVRRKIPSKHVEGIIFDLNGILHSVAQTVFMYGNGAVSEEKYNLEIKQKRNFKWYLDLYLTTLARNLNELIGSLNPKQYVIIAVDGIPPAAKISQQRERRYSRGSDSSMPPLAGFHSSMITSGTPFMVEIDKYLIAWIQLSLSVGQKRDDTRRRVLPPLVIYSSHNVPGEGEHKAFAHLRELKFNGKIVQGDGAHVVYGDDADLMMLSLLSPFSTMVIFRADFKVIISVDDIYFHIRSDMTANETSSTSLFGRHQICRDFVLLAMLIGNDFLPRAMSIDAGSVGSSLLTNYAKLGAKLTHLEESTSQHVAANIDLPAFTNYLWLFGNNFEKKLLDVKIRKEIMDEGTKHQRIAPSKALLAATKSGTQTVDYDILRSEWYTSEAYRFQIIHPYDEPIAPTDMPKLMTCFYIATMAWVLRYYTGGGTKINWLFAYPFVGAPLILDAARILIGQFNQLENPSSPDSFSVEKVFLSCNGSDGLGFTETTGPVSGRGKTAVNFAHQHLAVLPPSIIAEVTKSPFFEYLISGPDGPLSSYSPESFDYFGDGKHQSFEAVPLLPKVNLITIMSILNAEESKFMNAQYAEFAKQRRLDPQAFLRERVTTKGKIVLGKPNKLKYPYPNRLKEGIDAKGHLEYFVPLPSHFKSFHHRQ